MGRAVYLFLLLFTALALFPRVECSHPPFRETFKYFTPLSEEEEEGIYYIMTTLSTHSIFSLFRCRRELTEAGARTNGVHPLRFWKEVLINDALKQGLPNIGAMPKRQLLSDFVNSFDEAHGKGEMRSEYIEDFCHSTGFVEELFYRYFAEEQWRELLEHFFCHGSKESNNG